ncbi:MAG: Thymidylate synthase [Parcubacteria group bacterium GW2011_GWB1_55_9]|nr:MAG: Thymidylate synthase [Parcubacteria group bacterium GW2011_GWB1_55_9]
MRQYNDILKRIMDEGVDRKGRNGSTRALFALQMRFNLKDGFPAVTTKKLAFKAVKSELLWFIEGSSDDNRLKELNGSERTIWTDNAEADYWVSKAKFPGDLGRVYGVQWRHWRTPQNTEIDQLGTIVERIRTNPTDRRLVVSAWNPGELDQMALPPCHMLFQFFPNTRDKTLSLHMVQRSCDMFLGVPFNIASYALLLSIVAQVTEYTPHECILTLNDAHIYHDHFDAVAEQLSREPFPLSTLWLNPEVKGINNFKMDDIRLENYQSHPAIKAKMLV